MEPEMFAVMVFLSEEGGWYYLDELEGKVETFATEQEAKEYVLHYRDHGSNRDFRQGIKMSNWSVVGSPKEH